MCTKAEIWHLLQLSQKEIIRYVNSRFVTASEGCWRVFCFDVHGREPSVQCLAVHEQNLQMVTFSESQPEEAVSNVKDTTLLAWFKLNQHDPKAKNLKYELPEYYVWNENQQKWTPRKRGYCIGQMYPTNPSQSERHYL